MKDIVSGDNEEEEPKQDHEKASTETQKVEEKKPKQESSACQDERQVTHERNSKHKTRYKTMNPQRRILL